MRILIVGKNGMLGQAMQKTFHDSDFVAYSSKELDITNEEAVTAALMTVQPDIVINCAGYTAVDEAEQEEAEANRVNGQAVGILARRCRDVDTTLVHFSTDYVFDGEKRQGYDEEDAAHPINAYGRSKLLGEQLLLDEMESLSQDQPHEGKYFLIRTSWLFGQHGKNFVDTMLQLAQSREEVKVVDDQHGSPTFTEDLAGQVRWLIESHEYPHGIYHVTNSEVTTWYDFAQEVFRLAKLDVTVVPCSSEEFPRPAQRPRYSLLKNNKLPPLRSWQEALEEYLS